MPLAILAIADEGQGTPVLGASLLETQIRFARAAGAEHAVIFAERLTPQLLAGIDRLRRDGLSVDLARTVTDTSEMIHPEETVILVKAEIIIPSARLVQLLQRAEPMLLCVRDEPANVRYERIDATARWTGWAVIDGGLLRRTTAMVGDWDLGSTLMRRAVQEGAARVVLPPADAVRELIAVRDPIDAVQAGRRLVAATDPVIAGWATGMLLAPAARRFAQFVGEAGVEARWVIIAAFALFASSVLSAFAGWIVASLVFLLAGQLCDLTGDVSARATATATPWDGWRYPVRAGSAVVVILAMGITLFFRSLQWGCVILALVTIASTWLGGALDRENPSFARWRSDPSGLALIGLAGFIVGSPIAALAIAAGHAALSLGFAVRRVQKA